MTPRKIQKILCPVDFSKTSEAALRYAAGLAKCWDAEIIVLHAYSYEPPPYFTEGQIERLVAQGGEMRSAAEKALSRFVSTALPHSVQQVETVVEGVATEVISIAAATYDADLIVMGTHGRTGFRRFILGSIAEHTLHTARIPVLMIRPGYDQPDSMPVIRDVLCPVNDTVAARKALSLGAQIAKCCNAKLTLLHVKEASPEHAIPDLCAWVPASERSLCEVRELTREGKVAEEVLRVASELNCDLLVVGAWHRRFFDRTVIGCATAPIVRHADCPVLIVPAMAGEGNGDAAAADSPDSRRSHFDYTSYGTE